MQKKNKLSEIQPEEVSLVKSPANRQKFLIAKADDGSVNLSIESDGTNSGTVLKVNGKTVRNCTNIFFATGIDSEKAECSYSVKSKNKEGFTEYKSYYLQKGTVMNEQVLTELKNFVGEDVDIEKMDQKDAITDIQDALAKVNEYKEDLPDEFAKAIGVLAIHASVNCTEDVELVKEKVEKDADADSKKVEKDAEETDPEKEEVQKDAHVEALKEVTDAVTKMSEAITVLTKRVEVVEKSTNGRKSIPGQDVEKNVGTSFPSMTPITGK